MQTQTIHYHRLTYRPSFLYLANHSNILFLKEELIPRDKLNDDVLKY